MQADSLPFVSVIMPIRNEVDFIERSLGAVLAQDYPHERMEVLVADGMSTDGTRNLIAQLAANQDIKVTVVDNLRRIVSTGMNLAILQARGEIIIRVDGHAIVLTDYVGQCVQYLMKTDADCVGGIIESVGNGYIGEAIAIATSSRFGVGDSNFRTLPANAEPILTDTVPFGAFRREVFHWVGLFNEQMVRHQDYEFNYRLRKACGRILLLPKAKAKYYIRPTLGSLWKQYWQYGIWKGRFIRSYPGSLKPRHLIPPIFLLSLIVTSSMAVFSKSMLWSLWSILGGYAAFIFAALISLMKSRKLKYAPILPIIFCCLHMSWATGVWSGFLSPKISGSKARKQKSVQETKGKNC